MRGIRLKNSGAILLHIMATALNNMNLLWPIVRNITIQKMRFLEQYIQ